MGTPRREPITRGGYFASKPLVLTIHAVCTKYGVLPSDWIGMEGDLVRASFDVEVCAIALKEEADQMEAARQGGEYQRPEEIPFSDLSEDFKSQVERFPEGSPMRAALEKMKRGGEAKRVG